MQLHGRVHGQRSSGHPQKKWLDNVREDCKEGWANTDPSCERSPRQEVEIHMETAYVYISIARTLSQVSQQYERYELCMREIVGDKCM